MRRAAPIALLLALSVLAPALPAAAGNGIELYDARGQLITVVRGKERRIHSSLNDIAEVARMAVIAIEDSRFYDHHGVDLRGMARALISDLRAGGKRQGGSTITQQLIKNKYLTSQKTLSRKVDEALMAIQLEQQYSKDQILEMYLNEVYWGHGAYGIEAASQTYFGHGCHTLSLGEAALLAGMLRGPERYSPFRNRDLAFERQHVVLDRMVELGIIRLDDAERAKRTAPALSSAPGVGYRAPYFTTYVLNLLADRYGAEAVQSGHMKVLTTLDMGTQEAAEKAVAELVATKGKRYHFDQAALVAINPTTGGILAMVGGASFRSSQYNRVVLAHRQPGSTFKPLVYLSAFAQGIAATETYNDQPVTYMVNGHAYAPHNYQGEKEGTMSLRRALELSNNVVTIKLLNRIGPQSVVETARKIGITSPLAPTLSLGLGAYEVTPLELASAYGVFATNGLRTEPTPFWDVRDGDNRLLESHRPNLQRVFDEAPIRLLTDVLQGVVLRGTGTAAACGRPVAGKTGTTSDSRDAWFVGYTPQMVVALWTGNDDNSKMARSAAGGVVAAPTWGKFVKSVLAKVPVMPFAAPVGIAAASSSANASRSLRPVTGGVSASRSARPTEASDSHAIAPTHRPVAPRPTPTPERTDEDIAPDANL